MSDWDTFLNIVKVFLAFAIIIATITAFVMYAEPRTVYVPTQEGHWETVLPHD